MYNRAVVISLIALLLLALNIQAVSAATTARGKGLVLIMNPDCDGAFGKKLINDLKISISYRDYIGNFDIACSETLRYLGFDGIRNFLMPILRFFYPTDVFVFAYPESMAANLQQYLLKYHGDELTEAHKFSIERGGLPILGHANVEMGFAFAQETHDGIRHELAHLQTCAAFHAHGINGEIFDEPRPYPEGIGKPWCHA